MIQKSPPSSKPTLEEVRNQFETLHQGKQWGSRILDGLWEVTVKLSQEYSTHRFKQSRQNFQE